MKSGPDLEIKKKQDQTTNRYGPQIWTRSGPIKCSLWTGRKHDDRTKKSGPKNPGRETDRKIWTKNHGSSNHGPDS